MGAYNNTDGRSKLEEEIRQLEAVDSGVFKQKLPTVTLKEMSYAAPSDAEINASAQSMLAEYRSDGVNAINADSERNGDELEKSRDNYSAKLDSELAALETNYARAAENIDNDVLKRGIGRSSIAVGQKEELESDYARRRADTSAEYGGKIAELDAEIGALSAKLSKALDDFNIAYAAKLNETVGKLKAERAEKIEEVEKYNNDVRYKQAKLDESRAKTESKLYSDALSQSQKENSASSLSKERQDAIYKSVYGKMDEYLGSMTPDEARIELNNHSFYRQHLSDYYYYKLMDKYGR